MAENEDSQEKTEEPTDRRLERAFEEGSLMQPQDTYALGAWLALFAGIPLIWHFATRMVAWFREIGIAIVRRDIDTQALLGGFLGDALPVLGATLAIYLVVTLAIGLAQQRFRIQFRPLRASLGNLSVSRGFSRIFGPRTLLQTAFNAAKLAVSGALLAMALAMLLDRYKMIGVGGTASEAADLALQASMLLIQIVLAMLVAFASREWLERKVVITQKLAPRCGTPTAWWFAILTIGPFLGSLITEPAAMTLCALLLGQRIYAQQPSMRFFALVMRSI